ncbi:MAG: porin [Planctomycetaceae bacterium]|jgi:hypothetical protein|nr:porin [Planctomycetaceae bacterium]
MKNNFTFKAYRCLGIAAVWVALQTGAVNAGIFGWGCDPCDPAEVACEAVVEPCESVVCDPCEAICKPAPKSKWAIYTVFQAGVFANEFGYKDNYAAVTNISKAGQYNILSGNTIALENVRQTSFQVNQFIIGGGRSIDPKHGWSFGGHFDFAFGTDAILLQSAGLEFAAGHGQNGLRSGTYAGTGSWGSGDYYSSLAQLYFEAGYKNFNLKVGKFLSPLGSNSPVAPYRFFYTLPSAAGLYPLTQTGVLATWTVNKNLTVFGGWTNGIDTTDALLRGATFDSSDNGAFLGGFNYQLNKRINLKYSALIGTDERDIIAGDTDYFVQSFIAAVKLSKRWDYTFEWTLNNVNTTGVHHGGYGINQELIYKYSDKLSLGGRVEYTRYINGIATGVLLQNEDHYNFSLGASWTPLKFLTVKPEIRYDKFDTAVFNASQDKEQFSGGLSFIITH